MLEIVLVILVLILRGLIVWQMAESIGYIKRANHKRLALLGLLLYAGYVLYAYQSQTPVLPINIVPLIGILASLVAINKHFKKER